MALASSADTLSAYLVLQASPVPPFPQPGDSSGVVRITVLNKGPADVHDVDFGFRQDNISLPFSVSADLPGGCPAAQHVQLCFDWPGPHFGIGPIPANHYQSCLLELTAPQPITQQLFFPIVIEGAYADAMGTRVVNTNPSLETVNLVLALGPPTDAVPLQSHLAIAGLALLLAATGYSFIRASRRIAAK